MQEYCYEEKLLDYFKLDKNNIKCPFCNNELINRICNFSQNGLQCSNSKLHFQCFKLHNAPEEIIDCVDITIEDNKIIQFNFFINAQYFINVVTDTENLLLLDESNSFDINNYNDFCNQIKSMILFK